MKSQPTTTGAILHLAINGFGVDDIIVITGCSYRYIAEALGRGGLKTFEALRRLAEKRAARVER